MIFILRTLKLYILLRVKEAECVMGPWFSYMSDFGTELNKILCVGIMVIR
jgi:hypothetical protein